MSNKLDVERRKCQSKALNAKIFKAEKNSILISLPYGIASGIISHLLVPTFSFSLVISVGTIAIISILLFHFKFGKDLPKKTNNPNEYESPLTSYKPSSDNAAIQAYNRANGNPGVNFIMPKKHLD